MAEQSSLTPFDSSRAQQFKGRCGHQKPIHHQWHSCHHNQPVLHSHGEAFQEWVFYQTTCLGGGNVLLLCRWQMCPNSFSKCVPCSGVASTAGVHPSEEGAACPCSWRMSPVLIMARHLLCENVPQQINPSALDKGSRGDGRCSPTSLLLTPPSRLVHGHGIFFAGSWFSLLEFFPLC